MPLPFLAQAALVAGPPIISALFGGSKKGNRQQPSQQATGWSAADPEIKQKMLEAARAGYAAMDPEMKANFERFPLSQEDIDANPEFSALQAANPDNPLWQRGVLAQRTQGQRNALNMSNEGYGPEGLADYLQPWEAAYQGGAQEINDAADRYRQKITGDNALLNSRINPETNRQLQGQYNDLEQSRQKNLGGLRGMLQGQAAQFATENKFRHVAQQNDLGKEQFAYHQAQLDAANGAGRLQNNPQFQQAITSQQLNPQFLSGGTQTGEIQGNPGLAQRLGGAAQYIADSNFRNGPLYGPQQAGPYQAYQPNYPFSQNNIQHPNNQYGMGNAAWQGGPRGNL